MPGSSGQNRRMKMEDYPTAKIIRPTFPKHDPSHTIRTDIQNVVREIAMSCGNEIAEMRNRMKTMSKPSRMRSCKRKIPNVNVAILIARWLAWTWEEMARAAASAPSPAATSFAPAGRGIRMAMKNRMVQRQADQCTVKGAIRTKTSP